MTVTEVCQEMNLSRPAIYRRISDGRLTPLPKQNPNRDKEPLRFNRADVLALAQPRPKDKPLGG